MIKFRLQISVLISLLLTTRIVGQQNYPLQIKGVDQDSTYIISNLGITNSFTSREACMAYVSRMPSLLQSKGFVTASVDSLRFDSSFAFMVLFLGERYYWSRLDASGVDPSLLEAVGWRDKVFVNKPMDFSAVSAWQGKMLNYLENNGHPFARIYLDSLQIDKESVSGKLKVDKGPSYKIDSIRVYGDVKISNNFLQRYLGISNGSMYSKEKLQRVSRKMRELTWVEEEHPSTLSLLGGGSVLNLYLKPKRSSQVNLLVGFLPNNDQLSSKKLLVTGEANINLRNAFGSGETIGLNWQQLQVKSPRLNIIYQHPFIFNSPVGLDFAFDMFRKDSTFVNVNLQLGVQYVFKTTQSGKIFFQRFQTIVNGVNTAYVLENRTLPDEADMTSANTGIDYEFNNTNYRLNPRKGNEIRIITSVGIKNLKRNNEIMDLKDPNDPSFDFGTLYDTTEMRTYQFRVRATLAKYFPIGKGSTIKTAMNIGAFASGNVFKNELFQIGGYKLLRGFDEESQYLSQFVIGTLEYRILAGQANSYFYVFADGGWGRNRSQNTDADYNYIGTGLGLAFDTKMGIFNLAWAVGKRNDTEFNLRQSKLHFGFVNYF